MSERAHFALLAQYNTWMNDKLYAAAGTLPRAALLADRGAFFGSIAGTLNHIVAGDTIWLRRFATHPARFAALQPLLDLPAPASLGATHSTDLGELFAHRQMLDGVITQWVAALTDADLEHVLHYANTKGIESDKRFGSLVLHFFNHQTHHRGQASTLLSQAGVDIGVTDLLVLIPDQGAA
jgi:uncharacterized damage-inducible protein DinB